MQERCADVDKIARATLNRLYKVQPETRGAIARSAGYAVSSAFGTKIRVVVVGGGSGVAFDNRNTQAVYMTMVEAQAGLGFGVKKFRLVGVFAKASDVRTTASPSNSRPRAPSTTGTTS